VVKQERDMLQRDVEVRLAAGVYTRPVFSST